MGELEAALVPFTSAERERRISLAATLAPTQRSTGDHVDGLGETMASVPPASGEEALPPDEEVVEAKPAPVSSPEHTPEAEVVAPASRTPLFIGLGVAAVLLLVGGVFAFSGGEETTPPPLDVGSEPTTPPDSPPDVAPPTPAHAVPEPDHVAPADPDSVAPADPVAGDRTTVQNAVEDDPVDDGSSDEDTETTDPVEDAPPRTERRRRSSRRRGGASTDPSTPPTGDGPHIDRADPFAP